MKLKLVAFPVITAAAMAMAPAFAQQQLSDQCEQNPALKEGLQKYVQGDYPAALSVLG